MPILYRYNTAGKDVIVSPKKIFITIPWFLPAFRAGGPIQSIANLIKEFRKGVQYFIFCGDVDLNGCALENIETDKWIVFNEVTKVWYCSREKTSDKLVTQVKQIKPDALFIIGLYSWHFNIVPLIFCNGVKKILSPRGMLHTGALSQKKWKKKIFLQLFKLLGFQHKTIFHATSEDESNYIRNNFGKRTKILIAGNFPNKIGLLPIVKKNCGEIKMITIAIISPMKNILLVLDALEKSSANIQYDIYGPLKDEEYWQMCIEKMNQLPANISVVYHKEIEPAEIKNVLSKCHVFISPSKSENFGHSIYEALSAGRPVITSHFTPWNHLKESDAGINTSIENADEVNDAINFFAKMGVEEFEKWSRGAFVYSEKAVEVGKLRDEYESMFLG